MKTILVPTDFSDHALFALKVAASIARKLNATINLIHVYNLPSAGIEPYHYYDRFYKEMKTNASEQLNKLESLEFLKDITVEKHLITDMLMWEIATTERFKNADLIVMGSHGESGFNNVFIGSNTEKIVRLADIPVLTIKNELDDFVINKMVFASNFFADLYNAHIELLKVITPKDFEPTPVSLKLMEDFVKKFNLSNYTVNIYNATGIEQGIIDFSDEIKADLIAIETHGRTGFAHLINGSLTEDIVKHEQKPVLSIKIPVLSTPVSKYMDYRKNYENWGNE